MKSKSTAINLSSTYGMEFILQRKTVSTIVLGLLLLALAFGAVFALPFLALLNPLESATLESTSAGPIYLPVLANQPAPATTPTIPPAWLM